MALSNISKAGCLLALLFAPSMLFEGLVAGEVAQAAAAADGRVSLMGFWHSARGDWHSFTNYLTCQAPVFLKCAYSTFYNPHADRNIDCTKITKDQCH